MKEPNWTWLCSRYVKVKLTPVFFFNVGGVFSLLKSVLFPDLARCGCVLLRGLPETKRESARLSPWSSGVSEVALLRRDALTRAFRLVSPCGGGRKETHTVIGAVMPSGCAQSAVVA